MKTKAAAIVVVAIVAQPNPDVAQLDFIATRWPNTSSTVFFPYFQAVDFKFKFDPFSFPLPELLLARLLQLL
ncbi:hypothetical protein AAC387_Pa05g0021 [Persea americana]